MLHKWMKIIIAAILLLTIATSFNTSLIKASNDLIVGADEVNLRSGPGLSYSVIASLQRGEVLTSLDRQGDWIQVASGNHKGWVASWLVVSNTTKQGTTSKVAVSQANNLNIRAEASISSSALGQLSLGSQATVLQEKSNWVQIQHNGITGWVSKDYITFKNDNTTTNTANDGLTFTVEVPALNIREDSSLRAKKLATVQKGQTFKVLKQSNQWIQIEYTQGKTGWVYSFYGTLSEGGKSLNTSTTPSTKQIQTIYNGTNLRTGPATNYNVLARVDAGETFTTVSEQDGWYKISYNGQPAFIASSVVTSAIQGDTTTKKSRQSGTLRGLTIVIDPGHGGNDSGTIGVRSTLEKKLNLQVSVLLASKLRSAGADVVMTRESDKYVSLPARVSIAHQYAADAFVSIHHDAHEDHSIRGFTTYYTNSYQQGLAEALNDGLVSQLTIKNRGAQLGNYYITRENRQKAVLVELGYLSNSSEEQVLRSSQFQDQAAYGLYRGLLDFFN